MSEHEKNSGQKYRCWISDDDKILSFSYEEGYELIGLSCVGVYLLNHKD